MKVVYLLIHNKQCVLLLDCVLGVLGFQDACKLSKSNFPVHVTCLLLPALSICGYSGPLPSQVHRQGLLGHSFLLNTWGLSCVDVCFYVTRGYAHLIKLRYLKRVLWLFIKFCKCVLMPPVDPFSLDCQIEVCKMQAFKVLLHQFHTAFLEMQLKFEHFSWVCFDLLQQWVILAAGFWEFQ